jgi:arylsulfatase A-like enzyme
MRRRDFLTFMGGSALLSANIQCTEKNKRPNILFLFSDDQRADAIGAYGNNNIQTPHIDRILQNGYSFRNAYCMGSTHGAVCQPSRAMLLTGMSLYNLPEDLKGVKIFPELLREAGYETFGTGKWHNGSELFKRGFTHGKSIFFSGMCNHLKVPVRDLLPNGEFTDKQIGDKFSSELFADAAVDFLENYKRENPFYAYVSFSAPHDPRMAPKEYADMYDPDKIPLPKNFMPQHPFNNGWMTGRDEALAPWPRTPEIIRQQLAEYYAMITHMDAQIGRILSALKKSGQEKNTIIIFTSDQGLAMGSHGLLGKQNLYEQSMNAPLVFSGPGFPKGKNSNALVYLFDIFPTLCEMLNLEIPPQVEGKSLISIINEQQKQVRASLYLTYMTGQRAIRDERWKLIRYPKINKTQLFDLQNDIHELNNLADRSILTMKINSLMAQLRDWQNHVGDTLALSSDNPEPAEIDFAGVERKPDEHQPEEVIKKYFPEYYKM